MGVGNGSNRRVIELQRLVSQASADFDRLSKRCDELQARVARELREAGTSVWVEALTEAQIDLRSVEEERNFLVSALNAAKKGL